MPTPCFRAIVRGRVQGVHFRASTREKAAALELSGFARNVDDGSVEVVASGTPEALHQLRAYLSVGPPLAEVDDVDVEEDFVPSSPLPFPFGVRW